MFSLRTYLILVVVIMNDILSAQISPGKLSAAHSHLEGINNCTKCHDLGNKVTNKKCLDCHVEINQLIKNNRGYHTSVEVKSKNCTNCHSDHHGLKFDLVRFDEKKFDHTLTGYTLEGKHKTIDCRDCHQPQYIADKELKKRKKTFLGLNGNDCLACHDDYHQKTLSQNCLNCHDFTAFSPASKFDHNEADFKLIGEHTKVDCKACHAETVRNNQPFQNFANVEFNDCVSCHKDPHKNQLPGKCSQCHTEFSFHIFSGNNFDHNQTDFTLYGKHTSVSCFDCHLKDQNPKAIFQDKKGVNENECVACHKDVHDGKLGNDCAKCHSESSFLSLKGLDDFNHDLTDFALEGLHVNVDCKKCHTSRYIDPIDFSACINCHGDFHMGQLTNNQGDPLDCKECHVVTKPFDFTTYGIEEHSSNDFPLTGGHLATPCFSCHLEGRDWNFSFPNTSCIECHTDIHDGLISSTFYPEKDCKSCHNTESWTDIGFDHQLTGWPLLGKHQKVSCRTCHFDESESIPKQKFQGLSQNCSDCHTNIHGDQFEVDGLTECKRCHDSEDWYPRGFDHSLTDFPLEGKHKDVDCKKCHKKETIINGNKIRIFAIENFECIDCHL